MPVRRVGDTSLAARYEITNTASKLHGKGRLRDFIFRMGYGILLRRSMPIKSLGRNPDGAAELDRLPLPRARA